MSVFSLCGYYFLIIKQTWKLSIEDEEIKEDPEFKQMAGANANPVNLSHKQLWVIQGGDIL